MAALHLVCIGGGTGMPQLLSGLKLLQRELGGEGPIDLRQLVVIVSAFDDGGSSGRLMEAYDTLPPGDLRNCLLALADERAEPLMTRFLNHRFGEDAHEALAGHSVGNLLLLALAQVYNGDMRQALLNVGRILPIQSRILFPSLSPAVLCAQLGDGDIIRGESRIAERVNPQPITRVFLEKRLSGRSADSDVAQPFCPPAMEGVIEALDEADLISLGPGSLYTSVMPHLLVEGVADALARNQHKVVYICNIMNEPGETDGYSALDHVEALARHGGFYPAVALANDRPVSDVFYKAYARERLGVEFSRIQHQLEEAFRRAEADLDPSPLTQVAEQLTPSLRQLAEHVGQARREPLQVLPPPGVDSLPGGGRLIRTDLLGDTQLFDKGRTKRVLRHDPLKLARALISLTLPPS